MILKCPLPNVPEDEWDALEVTYTLGGMPALYESIRELMVTRFGLYNWPSLRGAVTEVAQYVVARTTPPMALVQRELERHVNDIRHMLARRNPPEVPPDALEYALRIKLDEMVRDRRLIEYHIAQDMMLAARPGIVFCIYLRTYDSHVPRERELLRIVETRVRLHIHPMGHIEWV